MNIDGREYVTVAEAAVRLGVTPQAVRNAIYEGSLRTEKLLDRHLIWEAELARYRAEKRPVGRPRKQPKEESR